MTEQELEAISARAEAATLGPWECDDDGHWIQSTSVFDRVYEPTHDRERRIIIDAANKPTDTDFIVHARTDVPALVAALREANAKIARMQMRIETVEVECNRHAEATKRVYAELRQANAKIIGLERAYH